MIIGHLKEKNRLENILQENRLGHAYLFHGNQGVGLLPIALWFAQKIIKFGGFESGQVDILNHPDVHFIFPVSENDRIIAKPKSDDFLEEWKQFIRMNPYASQLDWMERIGSERKQGIINVNESRSLFQKSSLSPFSSTYKILIIWNAEAMNIALANKCLKLIEEPPKNTVFLLTSTNPQKIISTIRSRLICVHIPNIEQEAINEKLISENIEPKKANIISKKAQGNWNVIRKLLENEETEQEFFDLFAFWTRKLFLSKTKPQAIQSLIIWAGTMSSYSREKQKAFISFCAERFRQALLVRYQATDLVYQDLEDNKFNFRIFSNHISGKNIKAILSQLNLVNLEIDRNVNSKFVFLDMSIQISRLI